MHTNKTILAILCFALAANPAWTQDKSSLNTYSPYSFFGLGDLAQPGFTANAGMAGITVGLREGRQIDYVNPAGATARDSLAFLLDFGGEMRNFYSRSASTHTSYNTANFHHLGIAFGTGRFGISAGIAPFSRVGYEIERRETNPATIAQMGDVRYQYRGEDGLSQVFLNLGFNFTSRIAVGLGGRYYFGGINQYYNMVSSGSTYYLNEYSFQKQHISSWIPVIGAHYTQPIDPQRKLVLGASWQPTMNLRGTRTEQTLVAQAQSSSLPSDTIYFNSGPAKIKLPMQLNVGATYSVKDRWMLGIDFSYRDWSKTAILNTAAGEMGKSFDIRLGGYYTPNLYDVRYFWKRFTYRGGLRFSQTPYLYNGKSVNDMAATVGLSMPVARAGSLNAALELGRRGSINAGVQETYINLSVSITILEVWFMRYRYE